MITKNFEKIRVRSLNQETYVCEIPFNWRIYDINRLKRRIVRYEPRIINQEYKLNSYPEE